MILFTNLYNSHLFEVLELPVNPPTEVPRQQFLQLVELAACGLPVKQVIHR